MRPRSSLCKVVLDPLSASTGLEGGPIKNATLISLFASVSYDMFFMAQ